MAIQAATPAAIRAAGERGINIAGVKGSGAFASLPYVQLSDVRSYRGGRSTHLARAVAKYLGVDISDVAGKEVIAKADVLAYRDRLGNDRVLPLDGMRRTIAERMSESMSTSPQYTMMMEADCLSLKAYFKEKTESCLAATGIKPTYSDIFIRACCLALLKNPMVNSSFMGDHILLKGAVNIGLAVSLGENGLIVPNIKNVQTLDFEGIVARRADLVSKARSGSLKPDEFSGGTFTISNLGVSPVRFFTPIINLPETAILGVGNIEDKVVPVDGNIGIRPIAGLSLTVDHRVIDGTTGEKFMKDLKEYIEHPSMLEGE
ncbi:MAG: 2-oxo acid dehydrogenase subunit E2 [Clostridiales Family XIII bacterium]|jgi:pyruvate dehydrogenase E2 component (dihydrolipoamide acetyltransferase)|nr:2-oxo acid dehydrogenase subunit E2 [Clostridiales Family XIII bacterium]